MLIFVYDPSHTQYLIKLIEASFEAEAGKSYFLWQGTLCIVMPPTQDETKYAQSEVSWSDRCYTVIFLFYDSEFNDNFDTDYEYFNLEPVWVFHTIFWSWSVWVFQQFFLFIKL